VRLDSQEQPMPYLHVPPITFGPFTIHAFGVVAALAVVLGARATRYRAAELGLDVHVVDRLIPWLVVAVFAGAHLVSVFAYVPSRLFEDPLLLLRFWDGLSSFGGILGGLIAVYLFFRHLGVRKRHYAQALLFGAVVSLLVGRLGCAVAHDHPGRVTTSPLAVKGWPTADTPKRTLGFYTDGPRRHDLGLYEFLFLIPLTGALYALRNVRPFEHFHVVLVLLMYTPVRFCLDFLRVSDRLYLGLTPGQYFSAAFFLVGVALAFHRHGRNDPRPPPVPA
jgi:phosphatidylglycerol:prolipoprotein diacylglycerol transferase